MLSKLKKSSKTEMYETLVFVLDASRALAETAIMLASKTMQRTTAMIFFICISPLNYIPIRMITHIIRFFKILFLFQCVFNKLAGKLFTKMLKWYIILRNKRE